jgi:hypothetical protein
MVWLQFIPYQKSQYETTLQKLLKTHHATNISSFQTEENVVLLIHDVDDRIGGLKTLLDVELALDVRSIIFVRPLEPYYNQSVALLRKYEREGFEVGIHYEIDSFYPALELLRQNFTVTISHAHGGSIGIDNSRISENHTFWNDLGLFDVSWLQYDSWIEDTHRVWTEPETFGSKVIFLTHSDYW